MADGEENEAKQVTRDPVLAAARHVVAHAVAAILLGVPFAGAEIGSGDAACRLIVDGGSDPATEGGMVCAMAGAAFDALLRPKAPLVAGSDPPSTTSLPAASPEPISAPAKGTPSSMPATACAA